MDLVKRFIGYAKIDTKSNPDSQTCPSTTKQLNLANVLVKELEAIGVDEVELDDKGYIYASIDKTINREIPTIGFIAHMDTAPSFSGKNVQPKIIENYDGEDIVLNETKDIVMEVSRFPELKHYQGQDLIVTDGTTLLGADDKAGIAEIITAMEYIIDNDLPHGDIKIAFTPDEEIGQGADHFDVTKFGADYAYTMDGGELGELEYENFNAARAKLTVNGVNVHPGTAKHKMKNSMRMAMELDAMLPPFEKPEYTEGYEGFFHLIQMHGDVEKTKMEYIIRDHDKEKFETKKELIQKTVQFLNDKYGKKSVQLDLKDSYYNMKEKIEPVYHIVENVVKAMEAIAVKPKIQPIRGGTDGARLSYMGLPTPNIFTGGHNFHGKFEYIPIQSMEKATELLIKLIELSTEE